MNFLPQSCESASLWITTNALAPATVKLLRGPVLDHPRQTLTPRGTLLFRPLAGCNWKPKTMATDPRNLRGQRENRRWSDNLRRERTPKENPLFHKPHHI
ncbi:hypothetical protein TNCV_201731 [Trichonephila clavipes]|nr:hypothetical protein TNCV_201731 [Trichonephila clavipes]